MKIQDLTFEKNPDTNESVALTILPKHNIQICVVKNDPKLADHSEEFQPYSLSACRPDDDGTHSDDYIRLSPTECGCDEWVVSGSEEKINNIIQQIEEKINLLV